MNFLHRSKQGKLGEKWTKELFESHDFAVTKNDKPSKKELLKWDLRIDGHGFNFSAEVKYDIMAEKTGNLAIEYLNTNSVTASGIMATAADAWIVSLTKRREIQIWLARSSKLLNFFLTDKRFRDIPRGGDGNAAMKLWSADVILDEVFTRIDEFSQTELLDLLESEMSHCHHSHWKSCLL